jgi:hypothetical protein
MKHPTTQLPFYLLLLILMLAVLDNIYKSITSFPSQRNRRNGHELLDTELKSGIPIRRRA